MNNIHAITRQSPITTIEKLLEVVFSVGLPQDYIARTPGWLSEFNPMWRRV
jgi:hypothetical protein